MCQLNNRILTINEDTICYKIEKKVLNSISECWVSMYMSEELEHGKVIKAEGMCSLERRNIHKAIKCGEDVNLSYGYFHSFESIEDARAEMKIHDQQLLGKFRIVKCVIPKGTESYIGRFKTFKTYASAKIKITEVCA